MTLFIYLKMFFFVDVLKVFRAKPLLSLHPCIVLSYGIYHFFYLVKSLFVHILSSLLEDFKFLYH